MSWQGKSTQQKGKLVQELPLLEPLANAVVGSIR